MPISYTMFTGKQQQKLMLIQQASKLFFNFQNDAKIREAETESDTESDNGDEDSDIGDDDNASSYTYASDNEDKEIKLKITNIISEWNDDSRSNQ